MANKELNKTLIDKFDYLTFCQMVIDDFINRQSEYIAKDLVDHLMGGIAPMKLSKNSKIFYIQNTK